MNKIFKFIKNDFTKNSILFIFEAIGTIANVFASSTLALMQTQSPLIILYIIWLISAVILTWCSIQRKSSSLTVLMVCFILINLAGLLKSTGLI